MGRAEGWGVGRADGCGVGAGVVTEVVEYVNAAASKFDDMYHMSIPPNDCLEMNWLSNETMIVSKQMYPN